MDASLKTELEKKLEKKKKVLRGFLSRKNTKELLKRAWNSKSRQTAGEDFYNNPPLTRKGKKITSTSSKDGWRERAEFVRSIKTWCQKQNEGKPEKILKEEETFQQLLYFVRNKIEKKKKEKK
ncbi:MAG TPA: hypothetical protein VJK25_02305 [Patescibacteria group bacterium]|nr:hypothetical protein [Patescibacteria group bacterium]